MFCAVCFLRNVVLVICLESLSLKMAEGFSAATGMKYLHLESDYCIYVVVVAKLILFHDCLR